MGWSEIDLNSRFLLGKEVVLSGIGKLKPLTIDEIVDVGFETYNQYLSMLCISSIDILTMLNLPTGTIIEPFEFISQNSYYNSDFCKDTEKALSLFFRDNVKFVKEENIVGEDAICSGYFEIGFEGVIHVQNFNFVIEVLKQQNCISTDANDSIKPTNDAETSFLKELDEKRRKYAKAKSETDMTDIISSVCAKHPSINLLNVGTLTIYQIIDQYMRLNSIDQYDLGVNSMLHGCSKDDANLTHWSSKQRSTDK